MLPNSTLRRAVTSFLAALTCTGVLGGCGADRENGPDAANHAANDRAAIARGAYLATAGNCAACHTAPGGAAMAGGLPFVTPFGTLYSTNITPDAETGIGSWSETDFAVSMRRGVRPDGEHLYPAFPYTAFTQLTDEDIGALYAYLRSLDPVEQENRANALDFPFSWRPLMAIWKALFLTPGPYREHPDLSAEENRGAYLVEALGHCSACHSPRNLLGAEDRGRAYGGGEYLDVVHEGKYRPWSAPNLTASGRGLGNWSAEDIAAYLGTARNSFLESFGPMNEVIMHSTRHLEEKDVQAMAAYLKTLPAVEEGVGAEPTAQVMGRGRTVYNLHCGTCHLPTGEGDPEMAPRLNRGSLVVQSENPASLINAILYAPKLPDLPPKWRDPMDDFQYLLDDEEVAAVATYIRNSWDNRLGTVTPEQVRRQRVD